MKYLSFSGGSIWPSTPLPLISFGLWDKMKGETNVRLFFASRSSPASRLFNNEVNGIDWECWIQSDGYVLLPLKKNRTAVVIVLWLSKENHKHDCKKSHLTEDGRIQTSEPHKMWSLCGTHPCISDLRSNRLTGAGALAVIFHPAFLPFVSAVAYLLFACCCLYCLNNLRLIFLPIFKIR